ncbi:hydroxyacid dehydrogenase [Streptomyces sp. NPDC049954]|uniref:hydroxyacid dehydrogenase n=1 Tax=Streptomyces sp. NPDC049954 TaxID=3155779 RepID=UPI00341D2CDC
MVAIQDELLRRLFAGPSWERLRSLGRVVVSPTPQDHLSPSARELLGEADVLVTGWGTAMVDAAVLDAAPRLKAVVHTAGSVKAFASPDCYERGVAISSQASALAGPVAEYTLAMILLAAKGAFRAERIYRSRRAAFHTQSELASYGVHGTRIGIIGASMVGRKVIELLRPFHLEVVVADPTIDDAAAHSLGVRRIGLDELMATCPVVSLHAPILEDTIGMITASHLRSLPDGATFINTARGVLVDQAALVAELETGRIEGILDVTHPEVNEPGSPLWQLPNLVLTPHIAGPLGTELELLSSAAVDEIDRVLSGRSLHRAVEPSRYHALA